MLLFDLGLYDYKNIKYIVDLNKRIIYNKFVYIIIH